MVPDSSLCLVRAGRLVVAVSVVRAVVQYQVTDLYQYTQPQLQVSCYCTCGPTQCQLPHCDLCYNLTRVSTPCSSSSTSSTTCCSVRLSHPHHHLTALRLGHSGLQLHYRLQTLSDTGEVLESSLNKVHVGREATAVHHSLTAGDLLLQVGRVPVKPVPQWVIVSPEGLRPGHVNLPQERDSRTAGWLRVEGGEVRAPSRQLISGGVHITTEDCRQQVFSADLTGLNLGPGTEDTVSELSWDGARTVTDRRRQTVKMRMLIRSPGGALAVFGNQTRLGSWRAALTVSSEEMTLNITTDQSQGLVLGRIQNVSFSFLLSSPLQASITTAIPILLPGMSDRVWVCLRVLTSRETCKQVKVVFREDQDQKYPQPSSDVQPIPVMWHLDSQPSSR